MLGSHDESRTYYVYLYLELHRDPGWRFVDNKSASTFSPPPPRVAYATDRSKAVVLVWFLVCLALWFLLRGALCCHALLFVSVFSPSPVKHSDHLAWGRESWSMCFLCIYLFILHASVRTSPFLSFFSSSWCQGLTAGCDCGTPFYYLFWFWGTGEQSDLFQGTSGQVPTPRVRASLSAT